MSAATKPGGASALQPHIESRILSLREQRVMLDADLASLYGVETKVLVQAIKRNTDRFPEDFMFQLSAEEFAVLRSQFVTSKPANQDGRGGRRYPPYAFTEQGVAMLSTVLGSPRAIAINIEIMRTFVKVRAFIATHQDLAHQLKDLQDKTEHLAMQHDALASNTRTQLRKVFETLRQLMTPAVESPEPPPTPKRPIGFLPLDNSNKAAGKPGGRAVAVKTAAVVRAVRAGQRSKS